MRRHAKALLAVVIAMLTLGASAAFALQTHPPTGPFDGSQVPNGSFGSLGGVAVDQSGGDVYVVDTTGAPDSTGAIQRFSSAGTYLSQLNGSATTAGLLSLAGDSDVAIDSTGSASDGTAYVTDSNNNLVVAFDTATGNLQSAFDADGELSGSATPPGAFSYPCGVAVDQSNGNVFVADWGNNRVWIFDSSGAYLGRVTDSSLSGPCRIALTSTGDLYVRNYNDGKVLRFNKAGASAYDFAFTLYAPDNGTPSEFADDGPAATDVAVNPADDHVYVDKGDRISEYDAGGSVVSTFGQGTLSESRGLDLSATSGRVFASDGAELESFGALVTVADVSTGQAQDITDTTATLTGSLDPAGGPDTTACYFEWGTDTSYGNTAPCAEGDAFNAPQSVSAELSGLSEATEYHYRLVVENGEGPSRGEDQGFASDGAPAIASYRVLDVGVSTAALTAEINPAGAETSYRFEYVSDSAFQEGGFSGAQQTPFPHASLGAGNASRTVNQTVVDLQPDTVYHVRVAATNSLGTGTTSAKLFRTFATPRNVDTGKFPGQGFLPDNRAWEMISPPDKNGGGVRPQGLATVISPDGARVGYIAPSNFGDTQGTGKFGHTQYVAVRHGTGWTSRSVLPTPNPDLDQLLVGTTTARYSSDLTAAAITAFDLPQITGDIPDARSNLYHHGFSSGALTAVSTPLSGPVDKNSLTALIGGSPSFDHIYFESEARLLPDAAAGSPNVYGWDQGGLSLAGVLPDGSTPSKGSMRANSNGLYARDTVSADGSKLLFRAASTGSTQLFMRKSEAATVQISESEGTVPVTDPLAVRFEAASHDLSRVAFTTRSALTDQDPGGSGTALYLFDDTDNPEGDQNLTFIARSPDEVTVLGMSSNGDGGFLLTENAIYHWTASTLELTPASTLSYEIDYGSMHTVDVPAMVSRDGMTIAFRTRVSHDGADLGLSETGEVMPAMYVYNHKTGDLRCASCPSSGTQTRSAAYTLPETNFGFLPESIARTGFLSADGRSVYFSTADALVSEDVNGKVDAYEYDRILNRTSLLSSGRGDRDSWFAAATASGSDVAIITADQLSQWDVDEFYDVYDARVNGGLPEPPLPATRCQGDSCQPAPILIDDPTPSSSAFSGQGTRSARQAKRQRDKRKAHRRANRGRRSAKVLKNRRFAK